MERKEDTHQKVRLGGLVVKAKLDNRDRAFLLGLLIDAQTIDQSSDLYRRMIALGEAAMRIKGPVNRSDLP